MCHFASYMHKSGNLSLSLLQVRCLKLILEGIPKFPQELIVSSFGLNWIVLMTPRPCLSGCPCWDLICCTLWFVLTHNILMYTGSCCTIIRSDFISSHSETCWTANYEIKKMLNLIFTSHVFTVCLYSSVCLHMRAIHFPYSIHPTVGQDRKSSTTCHKGVILCPSQPACWEGRRTVWSLCELDKAGPVWKQVNVSGSQGHLKDPHTHLSKPTSALCSRSNTSSESAWQDKTPTLSKTTSVHTVWAN